MTWGFISCQPQGGSTLLPKAPITNSTLPSSQHPQAPQVAEHGPASQSSLHHPQSARDSLSIDGRHSLPKHECPEGLSLASVSLSEPLKRVSIQSVLVAQLCPTFCDPMCCSLLGSLIHGILRQKHWSEQSFPSPGDLPNPGIKARPPSLQADSLLSKPPGNPSRCPQNT